MGNKAIKIKLLKKAKQRLNAHPGICSALSYVVQTNAEYDASRQLRNYISRALGQNGYLTGWVARKTGKSFMEVHNSHAKMLRTRKAWINWMIACLKEDIANGKT